MNHERYLRIVQWLRKRFAVNGMIVVSVGGKPTRYSVIEQLAWDRYVLGS